MHTCTHTREHTHAQSCTHMYTHMQPRGEHRVSYEIANLKRTGLSLTNQNEIVLFNKKEIGKLWNRPEVS